MEPSSWTKERSTLITPVNGRLGTGVTKMSTPAWAHAHGAPVAMASRTKPETATRENRACICDLQQRSYPTEYPAHPSLARTEDHSGQVRRQLTSSTEGCKRITEWRSQTP